MATGRNAQSSIDMTESGFVTEASLQQSLNALMQMTVAVSRME